MNESEVSTLLEFLRFPSVSTQSEHVVDMIACAEWLKNKFLDLGFQAEVYQTGGHPSVVARTPHDPAQPTILIYGHYDVQPPEPLAEWTTPPFDPSIRDGRIFARGATDNKGQIMAHILGAGDLLAQGDAAGKFDLPCRRRGRNWQRQSGTISRAPQNRTRL